MLDFEEGQKNYETFQLKNRKWKLSKFEEERKGETNWGTKKNRK